MYEPPCVGGLGRDSDRRGEPRVSGRHVDTGFARGHGQQRRAGACACVKLNYACKPAIPILYSDPVQALQATVAQLLTRCAPNISLPS
jgi:hypothetical protein